MNHAVRAAVAALLGGLTVTAQNGSIYGVINDADFQAPLGGATVLVFGTKLEAVTSPQGDFTIENVPPGTYSLLVTKDGYQRVVQPDVLVSAGEVADVSLALFADFTDMEEFVVQDVLQLGTGSERALLELRAESSNVFDAISADLMRRAGASDAASALRLVAGASLKDGKSAVIRGLPDRYVASLMNGVRLPSADDDKRAVELDQFPSAVIESVQVTKTFTPDKQGDASGGSVDVRLKGVPDKPFFINISAQYGYNSQVGNEENFLTYRNGGVNYWGKDDGRRDIQEADPSGDANWEGAVGVSRQRAPIDYKWTASSGLSHQFENGVRIGAFGSFYYERDSSFFGDGIDDRLWVTEPGGPLVPQTRPAQPLEGDFKTTLLDVTRGRQSVERGGLGTFGIEHEDFRLSFLYLATRVTQDEALLAEDTRGKQFFFPGYDPNDPTTPGHDQDDAAPYLRRQTLSYNERTTETTQVAGFFRLPTGDIGPFLEPEVDWVLSDNSARRYEPDKRLFGTEWRPARPGVPAQFRPLKPSANFTLGNLQRLWKDIEEKSEQQSVNLRLPFEQWTKNEGAFKFGLFEDRVARRFDQETFTNVGDNSFFEGDFDQLWSDEFPFENHFIDDFDVDVDYRGKLDTSAWFAMLNLPIYEDLDIVGGARFESTSMSIVNDFEASALWLRPGDAALKAIEPDDDPDASIDEDYVLPAVGMTFRPMEGMTFRAAYSETVARPTFKELTPILQQEFLGGPIFIGNPDIELSEIQNYDLRLDYVPHEGGLLSVSWFRKDIKKPIERIQRVFDFEFTTPVNYPNGRLTGWEFEVRQQLGEYLDELDGLGVGVNLTLINSGVTLPDEEVAVFRRPNIQAPIEQRDMAFAPERLLNAYLTYESENGTGIGIFYTLTGDTLLAGAGESLGRFVPNEYAREYEELNISLTQSFSEFVSLKLQAKNVTNPNINTVYRSQYIANDVTKTSFSRGIDYSISLGGEIRF